MIEEEIIKAGIEMPKALHKRVKGVANQVDLKLREAIIEALELWLSQHELKSGIVTATVRIPADMHDALRSFGEKHHLSIEQIVLQGLDLVLSSGTTEESSPAKKSESYASPESLEDSTPIYDLVRTVVESRNQNVVSLFTNMAQVALEQLRAGGVIVPRKPNPDWPAGEPKETNHEADERSQPNDAEEPIARPVVQPIRGRKQGTGGK